eukprot:4924556-Prymnesium_polylepis.1
MLLFFVTVAFGVLLAWLLLRSERVRAAYEVHSNYFGSVLGEQDMGAFSGEGAGYTWTQTNAEVEIAVPVAASARAKDVRCQVTASTLSLVCSGTQILQGRLFRGVEADDCDWKIGARRARPPGHCRTRIALARARAQKTLPAVLAS